MDLALNNLQRLICHKTKPKPKDFTQMCLVFTKKQEKEKERHEIISSKDKN